MALTATFAADLSAFERSLQQGVVQLQVFERAGKNATTGLRREIESISGQKLAVEAARMTEAVTRLGGAGGTAAGLLKLLPDELKRVSATIEQTAAKAGLLGEKVPDSIAKLRDEISKLPKPLDDVNRGFDGSLVSIGKWAAGFITAQAAIGLVKGAFRAYVDLIRDSVESYALAEAAQSRLTTALRASGTSFAIDQFNALGAEFQRTTKYSDDLIVEMEALLVQVGNAMPSQMKAALTAATNLASGLKIDLQTATTAVAKAMEGNITALQRYGIHIDEARLKTEGADAVFAAIQQRFSGQAQAEIGTYAGQIAQLANAWDDVKESIGGLIVNSPELMGILSTLNGILKDMTREGGDAKTSIGKLWDTWEGFIRFGQTVTGTGGFTKFLREQADAAERVRIAGQIVDPFKALADSNALPKITTGMALFNTLSADDIENKKKQKAAQEAYTKALEEFNKKVSELSGAKALKDAEDGIRKLAAAGGPIGVLTSQLSGLAETFKKASEAALHSGNTKLAEEYRLLARTLDPIVQFQQRYNVTIGEYVPLADTASAATAALWEQFYRLTGQIERIGPVLEAKALVPLQELARLGLRTPVLENRPNAAITRTAEQIAQLNREALAAQQQGIDALAQSLSQLAQISDNETVRSLAQLTSSMAIAGRAGEQMGAGFQLAREGGVANMVIGLQQMASGAIAAAASFLQATDVAGAANRALRGALSGAQAGAQLGGAIGGPIGAAIGTAIGGIAGLIGGLLRNPAFEDVMNRVGRDWGTKISEGLARQIADDAKKLFRGDRQTAEIFHIGDILNEAGGITDANFDGFLRRFRDVFSLYEDGRLSLQKTRDVLDTNFRTFADHVVKSGEIASAAFREFLELNQLLGTDAQAITDFIREQATRAGTAIAAIFHGTVQNATELRDRLKEAQAELARVTQAGAPGQQAIVAARDNFKRALFGSFGDAGEDAAKALNDANAALAQAINAAAPNEAAIKAAQDLVRTLGGDLKRATIEAQGDFERLGVLALGAFNAAIRGGLNFTEALDAAGPSIDAISSLMRDLGLQANNPALRSLLVARQVLQTPSGQGGAALNEAILSLSNINALNQETLDALGGSLENIFTRIQSEVASRGGTNDDALRLIAPFLANAQRAQGQGLTLDPFTQELLNQAKASGLILDAAVTQQQLTGQQTKLMEGGFAQVVMAVQGLGTILAEGLHITLNLPGTGTGGGGSGSGGSGGVDTGAGGGGTAVEASFAGYSRGVDAMTASRVPWDVPGFRDPTFDTGPIYRPPSFVDRRGTDPVNTKMETRTLVFAPVVIRDPDELNHAIESLRQQLPDDIKDAVVFDKSGLRVALGALIGSGR